MKTDVMRTSLRETVLHKVKKQILCKSLQSSNKSLLNQEEHSAIYSKQRTANSSIFRGTKRRRCLIFQGREANK